IGEGCEFGFLRRALGAAHQRIRALDQQRVHLIRRELRQRRRGYRPALVSSHIEVTLCVRNMSVQAVHGHPLREARLLPRGDMMMGGWDSTRYPTQYPPLHRTIGGGSPGLGGAAGAGSGDRAVCWIL